MLLFPNTIQLFLTSPIVFLSVALWLIPASSAIAGDAESGNKTNVVEEEVLMVSLPLKIEDAIINAAAGSGDNEQVDGENRHQINRPVASESVKTTSDKSDEDISYLGAGLVGAAIGAGLGAWSGTTGSNYYGGTNNGVYQPGFGIYAMSNFSIIVTLLCLFSASGADSSVVRSKRDEESPSNATTRQLGMFGFPSPYTPPYGGFHPGGFNSHQPYPSYGGYDGYKPNLTPMGPYQGVPSSMYQQPGFGAGSYPGSSPYGQYPPNGLYGAAAAQGPYYPSNPTSSPYPTNSFNPSYGTYPSNNVYNNYNPSVQNGYYNPSTSAVTSQNSYRPSGLIPDPFSSVAPIIGTSSYSPASNTGSSYNPSQISPQYNQQQYKPITIIDTPSYSPNSYLQGSNSYKPSSSSGSQEGYDSVVVTAQGMGAYDQPSSYKPSSGNYQPTVSSQTNYNKPQSPSYRPPSNSYSQQNSYRPITVQGSIQEIPNTPTYYPSHSQNRPSFYSATSDKVTFPNE